jgi:hypothetical protein
MWYKVQKASKFLVVQCKKTIRIPDLSNKKSQIQVISKFWTSFQKPQPVTPANNPKPFPTVSYVGLHFASFVWKTKAENAFTMDVVQRFWLLVTLISFSIVRTTRGLSKTKRPRHKRWPSDSIKNPKKKSWNTKESNPMVLTHPEFSLVLLFDSWSNSDLTVYAVCLKQSTFAYSLP